MTNTKATKLKEATPLDGFMLIPLGQLAYSPTNPRKTFDERKLAELAASIRANGVRQPILVRYKPDTTGAAVVSNGKPAKPIYEVIFGERRTRASVIAERESIPVQVVEMADEAVLDAQIEENLQREDVLPLEEAEGFLYLKNVSGKDVRTIAERVNRSESYVASRIQLASLIDEAKDDLRAERITLSHALLICRLTAEQQAEALNACYRQKYVNNDYSKLVADKDNPAQHVSVLRAWIEQNIHLNLKKAPFRTDDTRLRPDGLACIDCPQRTGYNKALFEDISDADTCTYPPCYSLKIAALVQITREEIATKLAAKATPAVGGEEEPVPLPDVPVITTAHYAHMAGETDGMLVRGQYMIIEKKKDRCEHAEQAVIGYGADVGQKRYICRETTCKEHLGRKSLHSPSAGNLPGATTEDEARRNLEARRKRTQELFDLRVAEKVRRRTLRAVAETLTAPKGKNIWPLKRQYFEVIAREHFLRIQRHTQEVIIEAMDWTEKFKTLKPASTGLENRTSFVERQVLTLLPGLSNTQLVRFHFLCSVAHFGENEFMQQPKDQKEIIALAAAHKVNYRLYDAEERVVQAKRKYQPVHVQYLERVRAGDEKAKPPKVTGDPPVIETLTASTQPEAAAATKGKSIRTPKTPARPPGRQRKASSARA